MADSQVEGEGDGTLLLGCAKCALTIAIGVVHCLPPAVVSGVHLAASDRQAGIASFYYRLFPETASRPPKHHLS